MADWYTTADFGGELDGLMRRKLKRKKDLPESEPLRSSRLQDAAGDVLAFRQGVGRGA